MLSLIILWALVGWTGIEWPPHTLPPTDPPDPHWVTDRLLNAVGAVIGGIVWNLTWPVAAQSSPGLGAGVSCIGAVLGAALMSNVVQMIRRRSQ